MLALNVHKLDVIEFGVGTAVNGDIAEQYGNCAVVNQKLMSRYNSLASKFGRRQMPSIGAPLIYDD